MAKIMLSEWNGWGLNNGEHLDYSKAVRGVCLCAVCRRLV